MIIVPIRHEALWSSVPSGWDVLGVGMFAIDSFARTEIGKLDLVARNEDILRFDIPMENPFSMYKSKCLKQPIHIELNFHVVKVTVIY